MQAIKFKTVDEYIATFPEATQAKLEQMRSTLKKALPKASEVISYNMPAYKQNGVLVYFSGNREHIGFYPTPSAIVNFQQELVPYKTSKGAIQLPLDKALPVGLVTKIAKFRAAEDAEKAAFKAKK
ncbi:MAG TPA: DUF1801 domain-containing protein [Chitinophagaceae bacterium]|nr:DUF1801 domain-containing protein [Chitinophagaceae bacterium]